MLWRCEAQQRQLEQFNFEKLDCSARICLQILAAKCLQAGFARR
jgi:hypothetical protein